MHDDPFLVLAMIQGCMPVFDMLFDSILIGLGVLLEET
jgi:hypothetical protein